MAIYSCIHDSLVQSPSLSRLHMPWFQSMADMIFLCVWLLMKSWLLNYADWIILQGIPEQLMWTQGWLFLIGFKVTMYWLLLLACTSCCFQRHTVLGDILLYIMQKNLLIEEWLKHSHFCKQNFQVHTLECMLLFIDYSHCNSFILV